MMKTLGALLFVMLIACPSPVGLRGAARGQGVQAKASEPVRPLHSYRQRGASAEAVAPVVFTQVTVIDVASGAVKPGQTVVVRDDRIVALGAQVVVPKNARVIQAAGKFLLPGLWDMHVHLSMAGEAALPLFIAQGVTSVREMGGQWEEIKAWQARIAAGTLLGPRIRAAGPVLENPRSVARMADAYGGRQPVARVAVGSVAEAAPAVAAIAALGVDFLKLRTNESRETYLALAAEARRAKLTLVGHAPAGVSLAEASDAGQRSIEHGLFPPPELSATQWPALFARFVRNGTYVTPTLISLRNLGAEFNAQAATLLAESGGAQEARRKFVTPSLAFYWGKQLEMRRGGPPPAVQERNLQALRALHRAGGRLLAGTDVGVPLSFPGLSLHEELELLVKQLGLTPLEALRCATLEAARFSGRADVLGTVAPGKLADLILLTANPLDDIRNTQKLAGVMLGGRWLPEAELR